MSSWTGGYVDEIGYIHGFYHEMVPSRLAFAALAHGRRSPDPAGPLAYCDLGCGQGFTTNALAAANPHIRFHATDFNPVQIAGARALAAEAGLDNVAFSDASFAEYLDDPDLPMFDIIALQGIYTWVSAEHRATIVEFIRRRLKVGGLVYVSYNALPGWAGNMPLRMLLADQAARGSGSLGERIEQSIAFAERLRQVGAAYFGRQPAAGHALDTLKGQSRSYVAHEYFNRHWTPHYFSAVAAELAEAKLGFVGSAHVLDLVDDVNHSAAHQTLLGEISDPVHRETVRDYLTMQIFRRDLFAKGPTPMIAPDVARAWLEQRLVLTRPRADVPLSVAGHVGEAQLQPGTYEPLLDALAKGPRSVRDLRQEPAIAGFTEPQLREAVTILIGAGHVQPCLPEAGEAERRARTRAFNHAVTRRAEFSTELQFLASPVSGGALHLGRFPQLFVGALEAGEPDPPAAVWRRLEASDQQLIAEGRVLQTPEENLAELRTRYAAFEPQLAPLRHLGIVG